MAPWTTVSKCPFQARLCVKSTLAFKNSQHNVASQESPTLLIPINLSSEQGAGSQSMPLKFEHDLTLCLQLSNVSATAWLLSSSGSHPLTPEHVQIWKEGHDQELQELSGGDICQ